MAEEDYKSLKEQERDKRKFDPVGFVLAVILVGLIVIFVLNFLGPTIGNVFVHLDSACYSMSQHDYDEISKTINNLIAGRDPDTPELIYFLLTEGPLSYLVHYYGSFSAVTGGGGDFCDNHSREMHQLLNAAYESAQEGRNSTAQYLLWQAKFRWNLHNAWEIFILTVP